MSTYFQDPPDGDDDADDDGGNTNIDWTTASEPDPGQVQAWDIGPDGAWGWTAEE